MKHSIQVNFSNNITHNTPYQVGYDIFSQVIPMRDYYNRISDRF